MTEKRRAASTVGDTKRGTTVGLFGHSFYDDGNIYTQFEIVREVQHGFIVQRYSWLTGKPTDLGFMRPEDLAACTLYSGADEWHTASHAEFETRSRKESK